MALIVASSDVHAAGVFTTTPIRKGKRIVEYTGPRVTKEEGDRIYDEKPVTYLFALEDGRVIDGHGIAMFINHCCDPNCETDEVRGKIWVYALRNIQAGEELTYDYNLVAEESDTPAVKRQYACGCGARNCRGTMLGAKR